MSSVVLSVFDIIRFYYFGFLSPKADIRINELEKIKHLDKVIETEKKIYVVESPKIIK